MKKYDVIIVGGGAAGLSAARECTIRGRRTAILDMGARPARKVMASGGGRCNFTNTAAAFDRYFGKNPQFVRAALARVSPTDILNWVTGHKLAVVEKAPGQYFCADGADAVVRALMDDARDADIIIDTTVAEVIKDSDRFIVRTSRGEFESLSVIVATGGVSFGALGVSDVGYKIAKTFGHKIIPVRPALCAIATKAFPADLSGIAIPVELSIGKSKIADDMLFTHFGIGGPVVYRATVRDMNSGIKINMLPGINATEFLCAAKKSNGRKLLASVLGQKLPVKVAKWIAGTDVRHIADYKNSELNTIAEKICNTIIPQSDIKLHNLASAEVVRGGIATDDISSKTMESKLCPGLFFVGEVVDIAGDLGGFNLQWAWASGIVAGQNA